MTNENIQVHTVNNIQKGMPKPYKMELDTLNLTSNNCCTYRPPSPVTGFS